jgi:hypothetical protein
LTILCEDCCKRPAKRGWRQAPPEEDSPTHVVWWVYCTRCSEVHEGDPDLREVDFSKAVAEISKSYRNKLKQKIRQLIVDFHEERKLINYDPFKDKDLVILFKEILCELAIEQVHES